MKKFFLLLLTVISLFLMVHKSAFAAESFNVDVHATYEILESGITHVSHRVTIENLDSITHAEKFSLNLVSIDPMEVSIEEDGKPVRYRTSPLNHGVRLDIDFTNAVVGLGEKRTFTIEFDERNFASRTGEVWEISIPRLTDKNTFDSYEVDLIVPTSFGNEAYISPDYTSFNSDGPNHIYSFSKDDLTQSGITAGFGKFQVFSFSLSYHLENPTGKKTSAPIALPPDNSIQRVYYEDISPLPENIFIDPDGNWLAEYQLGPRERLDVVAKGSVQIYSSPRPHLSFDPETLAKNLSATEYWPSADPEIIELSNELSGPKEIYGFVVETLSYNYERVQPNVERLGAAKALRNPENAICMEFTDLFITLARASGIPAREVNGYAYTENPEIEPLSLVADVLHAWPEYWDQTTKTWIPVDPTWGSTTEGVDFFNKLDLRHFAFVIHGIDDTNPVAPGSYKLGSNPQKDVYVSFGQLPTERNSTPIIRARRVNTLPFLGGKVSVSVTNPGPQAIYNLTPTVGYDETVIATEYVEVMPPHNTFSFEADIPYSFFGTKTPDNIVVNVDDTMLQVPTLKNLQVFMNLIVISLVLISAIVLTLIKSGKLKSWKRRFKSDAS